MAVTPPSHESKWLAPIRLCISLVYILINNSVSYFSLICCLAFIIELFTVAVDAAAPIATVAVTAIAIVPAAAAVWYYYCCHHLHYC